MPEPSPAERSVSEINEKLVSLGNPGQGSSADYQGWDLIGNPADGSVISRVPLSTQQDVDEAVEAAKKALPGWAGLPIKERVQVFFRYRSLLEQHHDLDDAFRFFATAPDVGHVGY